jgi:hypothetical protein
MKISPAAMVSALLLVSCASTSSGTSAATSPTSPPASTASSSPSADGLPQECQTPEGQVLTKDQAALCYPILAAYTGAKLPDVTNAFTSGPVDLANAKNLAQIAFTGLSRTIAGLRAARWPADVAPLCAQLADKWERYAEQMRLIADATSVKQAEAAFHQFEKIRGPVPPDHLEPIGKQIRIKLGLLPPGS